MERGSTEAYLAELLAEGPVVVVWKSTAVKGGRQGRRRAVTEASASRWKSSSGGRPWGGGVVRQAGCQQG